MFKVKAKKAIKVNSEEGDYTPTGTEIYILGYAKIPEEVNKEAMEYGIKPIPGMYATVQLNSEAINLMSASKVDILKDELVEIELNTTEEEFLELQEQLDPLGFKFFK